MSYPETEPSLGRSSTDFGRSSSIRFWALALTAGGIAGLASWLIGESVHGRLQPQLLSTGGIPTAEQSLEGARGIKGAVTLEASAAFGSLGAALGLALGLVGRAARRVGRSRVSVIGAGTILGGITGVVLPQILLPIYFQFYSPDSDDLLLALLTLGGIAGAVGATGGVAFGLGLGERERIARTALGGLIGAFLGILIYVVAGTLAFPLDQTTKPISATSVSRLLARLIVAVCAAAGVTAAARPNE